jgi:hypothetical protein
MTLLERRLRLVVDARIGGEGRAAMVRVSIQHDSAIFDVQGLHKLWAFKSRLTVPLAHIKSVRLDPNVMTGLWKGLRMPGTHVPGIIVAGTYYKDGKRFFWDVRNKQHAIVIELVGEPYQELIIEVDDPSTEIARLHPAATSAQRSA